MDTVCILFFMLIQPIVTPAFCIQCLFVGGSELPFPWHGSEPLQLTSREQQTQAWAPQGQADCVACGGPWPGPALTSRVNQESLPLSSLPSAHASSLPASPLHPHRLFQNVGDR